MMVRRVRPCPKVWLSPPEVFSAIVPKPWETPAWLGFCGRHVTLMQSGRAAIAQACKSLGLHAGDEILMSAYNCGSEVDALLASGLSVRCIDSEMNGFMSQRMLEDGLGPRTRAIYVIHPFGWPQPLEEIDNWRKGLGLLLIEDCALALFSTFPDGEPVGTRGDAAIFSFPKTLPCPDGGALTLNVEEGEKIELRQPPIMMTARQLASRMKAWTKRHLMPMQKPAIRKTAPDASIHDDWEDMPTEYYFESWRARCTCSAATGRLLGQTVPEQVVEQRTSNYRELSGLLLRKNFHLLFPDLPRGVCPLSCPIRTKMRNEAVKALGRYGIETSPWWSGGHREIDWAKFPNACSLKREILPLPVHQRLGEFDMRYIAEATSNVLG